MTELPEIADQREDGVVAGDMPRRRGGAADEIDESTIVHGSLRRANSHAQPEQEGRYSVCLAWASLHRRCILVGDRHGDSRKCANGSLHRWLSP